VFRVGRVEGIRGSREFVRCVGHVAEVQPETTTLRAAARENGIVRAALGLVLAPDVFRVDGVIAGSVARQSHRQRCVGFSNSPCYLV
jgi:hypothetical protein